MDIELEEEVKRVDSERKTKFLTEGGKVGPLISKLLSDFVIISPPCQFSCKWNCSTASTLIRSLASGFYSNFVY